MQTVINFRSVQYAKFGYRNQDGDFRTTKPKFVTVHNSYIDADTKLFGGDNALVKAQARGLIDIWTPWLRLVFTANKHLVFKGERAVKTFAAFRAVTFKK
jgi:hypothetical protein